MKEDAKKTAEALMPDWKPVETPQRQKKIEGSRKVDSVGVNFEALREIYFGTPRNSKTVPTSSAESDTHMVLMQLGDDEDFRKTVVVRNGKIIGAQG